VLKDVHTWWCSSLFQHGYTRMPAYCFTYMRDWEWWSFLLACLLIWPNYLDFLIWEPTNCDSYLHIPASCAMKSVAVTLNSCCNNICYVNAKMYYHHTVSVLPWDSPNFHHHLFLPSLTTGCSLKHMVNGLVSHRLVFVCLFSIAI